MKDLKQKATQFFLLSFLWVIFPLFSVEMLMIILEPYLYKGFYQYDSDIGFRVRPNVHYIDPLNPVGNPTNQFGFNDRDYPLEKAPGTFRIVVLGDSYNWMGGTTLNYTAFLEQKLQDTYGEKVEIINIGYPGTNPGQYLTILKKYGLQYNPDLVILGFFAGNDFFDANPDRRTIYVNDVLLEIDKDKEWRIFGYPIIAKSRLLAFIQQKYQIISEQQKAQQAAPIATPTPATPEETPPPAEPTPSPEPPEAQYPGTFAEETFLSINKELMSVYDLNVYQIGGFKKQINYVFKVMSKMQSLLEENNIDFQVAIYPAEFQVDENLRDRVFETYNLNPEDYDLELAQTLLTEVLSENGIPYINMLERFRAEAKNRDLYLLRDTHWNTAGNELAADILFENLQKTLTLSKSAE